MAEDLRGQDRREGLGWPAPRVSQAVLRRGAERFEVIPAGVPHFGVATLGRDTVSRALLRPRHGRALHVLAR
jgi:hypothetical protein